MIFTTKAEYGVRLLIQLGLRAEAGPVSRSRWSRRTERAVWHFLRRIAALLKKVVLVDGHARCPRRLRARPPRL